MTRWKGNISVIIRHQGKRIVLRGVARLTFGAPTDATGHPHPRVEMQISGVSRLHVHVQTERIRLGVHVIRLGGILELLQYLPRPDAPAVRLDGDEGGGMIVGLQQVVGVDVGGQIGSDELRVLATRLRCATLGQL